MRTRKTNTRFFISTFQTSETRQTYKEKEQIMTILSEYADKNLTCKKIVKIAAKRGWTTPLVDKDRLAMAHPYWRILTSITTEGNNLYASNVKESVNKNGILCYMISSTHHFEKNMWIRNDYHVVNGVAYKKRNS